MFYGTGNQVSALKGVILTLVGIGFIVGLALMNSDLIHPIRSISQYQREQLDMEQAARQNEIDLQQYAALKEAQTQAELQRIAEETAYIQQTHQQELELARLAREQELQIAREREALKRQLLQLASYAAFAAVGLSMLALSIGGAVYIARLQSAHVPAQARVKAQAREATDVWTPERRRQEREAARQRERQNREWALRQDELIAEKRLYELFQSPARSDGTWFDDLVSLPT